MADTDMPVEYMTSQELAYTVKWHEDRNLADKALDELERRASTVHPASVERDGSQEARR
jgi:hypothetical protein